MNQNEILEAAKEADPFGEDGRLYSIAQLTPMTIQRFAAIIEKRTIERCDNEFHLCLSSDLEHGVKSLNEKAADEFKRKYPALHRYAAAIRKLGDE